MSGALWYSGRHNLHWRERHTRVRVAATAAMAALDDDSSDEDLDMMCLVADADFTVPASHEVGVER